ncbi:hypothetical protein [Parvibaculum sp.]|uniref:hypothetical protein n=1 Tax=Parvibaculum sp. TaxID=2024848 RepID=UPI0027323774|nr:hypothetical protein [Parvibaculum sp.]MDP3328766.1 hypothetical protein [Parvibaculum sp.]
MSRRRIIKRAKIRRSRRLRLWALFRKFEGLHSYQQMEIRWAIYPSTISFEASGPMTPELTAFVTKMQLGHQGRIDTLTQPPPAA